MSELSLNVPQSPPIYNPGQPAVWDLVLADLGASPASSVWDSIMLGKARNTTLLDVFAADVRERDGMGTAKYNTRLQTFNGRDPLIDFYQELMDAVAYSRQAYEEGKDHPYKNQLWHAYERTLELALDVRLLISNTHPNGENGDGIWRKQQTT